MASRSDRRRPVNYTITEEFENANRAVAHSIYLQDQWDAGADDAAGCAALRPREQLGASRGERHRWDVTLQLSADLLPPVP